MSGCVFCCWIVETRREVYLALNFETFKKRRVSKSMDVGKRCYYKMCIADTNNSLVC